MRIISKEDYQRLIQDKALSKQLYKEIKAKNKIIENLEDLHESKIRKLTREHNLEREELQVLRELHKEDLKLSARKIDLETREALLKAKNDEFDTLAKELAENRKKAEEARKEGEKTGYADGVADGLREATKITADDRKMMGQIAALAAASHQGDASKQIAEAIAKDMHNALPANASK